MVNDSEQQTKRSGSSKGSSRFFRGVILALLGGIGWGFSGACGQFLFSRYGVDPTWLTAVRMPAAGLILLVTSLLIVSWRRNLIGLFTTKKDLPRLALYALAGMAACQFAYLMAINYSNAGTATVLEYVGPVLIVLWVCLRAKKAPKPLEIVAVLCVVVGVFLLATHGNIGSLALSPEGLTWGLIAAFTTAVYTILPERLMKKWGSVAVTTGGLLIGGVVMACAFQPWAHVPELDAAGWAATAVMIVVGTVLSFTFYLQAVTDIGAARTSLIASVETISATLFAVFWLGTEFVPLDIIGFAFIMSTVFLLTRK